MNERSNPVSVVSLLAGVAAWVLLGLRLFLATLPVIGLVSGFLTPVALLVALVGVVAGVLGWRQARVSSLGGIASMVGLGCSATWFLAEGLLAVLGW